MHPRAWSTRACRREILSSVSLPFLVSLILDARKERSGQSSPVSPDPKTKHPWHSCKCGLECDLSSWTPPPHESPSSSLLKALLPDCLCSEPRAEACHGQVDPSASCVQAQSLLAKLQSSAQDPVTARLADEMRSFVAYKHVRSPRR